MTWKLTFTLIVIIGGILTGLAPLFLFTDFRAELEVGIMLVGIFAGIIILLSAGVPIGFASGVLGALVIWLNFGLPGLGLVMIRVSDLTSTASLVLIPFYIDGFLVGTIRNCARYLRRVEPFAEACSWRCCRCDRFAGGYPSIDVRYHWR